MECVKTYRDSHSEAWILAWFHLVPTNVISISLQQVKRFAWFLAWFHLVPVNWDALKCTKSHKDSH